MKRFFLPALASGSLLGVWIQLVLGHGQYLIPLGVVITLISGWVWRKKSHVSFICVLVFSGFILGMWRANWWLEQRQHIQPHTWVGVATVSQISQRSFGMHIVLDWDKSGPFHFTGAQIETDVSLGELVQVTCELEKNADPQWQGWFEAQGVAGECVKIDLLPLAQPSGSFWFRFRRSCYAARGAILRSLNKAFIPPTSWLASGLVVGDRGAWDQSFVKLFQRVGLSHIVALSGWNVTILSALILAALLRLGWSGRAATILGLGLVWTFVIMTGASASIVRAAVMGVVSAAARLSGRPQSALRILLLAAAAIVLFEPATLVWDVSFHLSVLATFALVMSGWKYFDGWDVPVWELSQTIKTSVAVSLVTAPYLIWKFHQISLIAIPLNILVLPLVPIATASATLACLFTSVGGSNPTLVWILSLPIQLIIQLARLSATLPWANVSWQ